MEKSYVTLEQAVCPACGKTHDTGALLLDRRLRNLFDMHTPTHFDPCPECKTKLEEGYILLVEVDPTKSEFQEESKIKPQDAYRTGRMISMRRNIFEMIFVLPAPPKGICFIEPEAFTKIERMTAEKGAQG